VMLISIVTTMEERLTPLSLVIRGQGIYIVNSEETRRTDVVLCPRTILR
jgi:hypothetical protein